VEYGERNSWCRREDQLASDIPRRPDPDPPPPRPKNHDPDIPGIEYGEFLPAKPDRLRSPNRRGLFPGGENDQPSRAESARPIALRTRRFREMVSLSVVFPLECAVRSGCEPGFPRIRSDYSAFGAPKLGCGLQGVWVMQPAASLTAWLRTRDVQ